MSLAHALERGLEQSSDTEVLKRDKVTPERDRADGHPQKSTPSSRLLRLAGHDSDKPCRYGTYRLAGGSCLQHPAAGLHTGGLARPPYLRQYPFRA